MRRQILIFLLLCLGAGGLIFYHQSQKEGSVSSTVLGEYRDKYGFEKERQQVNQEEFQLFNFLHDSVDYQKDVTYKSIPERGYLTLDYAIPKEEGKYPLLLCLHPGAWTAGDKEEMSFYLYTFSCYGYAVATVDYGLVPHVSMIEQTENILDAVQYMVDTFPGKIDKERVIILGASSGAHLGMLATERLTNPELSYREMYDYRLAMVVAAFGPLDFDYFISNNLNNEMLFYIINNMQEVVGDGAYTYEDVMDLLSPGRNLNPYLPRVLVIHGVEDNVIPIAQSRAFYEALLANGTPADMIEVQHGGHYMITKEFAEPIYNYLEEYIK